MKSEQLVVKTKLVPPQPPSRILYRSRLADRLQQALEHRVVVVHAGAGFGKSTVLTSLSNLPATLIWYQLDSEDAEPFIFLRHLLQACRDTLSLDGAALANLEGWSANATWSFWKVMVDLLTNEMFGAVTQPVTIVFDDAHYLNKSEDVLKILDRLAERMPRNFHLVFSTRYPLKLPNLSTWRLQGYVLEINQRELAFTPTEIETLFNEFDQLGLKPAAIQALAVETEGWPIALQLLRQGLQTDRPLDIARMLNQLRNPAEDLFTYLTQEVLSQQSAEVQEFLLTTAVLRVMTVQQCNCLRSAENSELLLKQLSADGLFIAALGDGHFRYHPLFQNLLNHQLTPKVAQTLHQRAADCYRHLDNPEETIHHLMVAGDFEAAATLLDDFGRELVWAGRLKILRQWLHAMPIPVLNQHAGLLIYQGDIARLHSRFSDALAWYRQAEALSRENNDPGGTGRALRGQARIYLDTVNPSQAEKLLREALQLTDDRDDEDSRTRLLNLLAENMLNAGQVQEAEQFRTQADALRSETPSRPELNSRVFLRTGQIHEAWHLLQAELETELNNPVQRPRGHREPFLVAALAAAFLGKTAETDRYARSGIERAEALKSPFSVSIGYMRRGHANLLYKRPAYYRRAIDLYQEALAISETLMVARLKPEAYWGLCQAYGFQGDLSNALRYAEKGIEIVIAAGDEWLESLIRLTMGAGYVLAGQLEEAVVWLNRSGNAFRECSDPHGEALVHLWRALMYRQVGDQARVVYETGRLLQLSAQHRYGFLFKDKTLLGPPDPRQLVPLLLTAKQTSTERMYAVRLLADLGLDQLEIHPGYQLQVQTLGNFVAWRGDKMLSTQDWQRKKSRQLFQLLLTYQETMLNREKIFDLLWPDVPPDKAKRDFKVALSTLGRVLEPDKPQRTPSAYILREDDRYGLRPGADITIDAVDFMRLIHLGDQKFSTNRDQALTFYKEALTLYEGDYLPEAIYDDWSIEARERLLAQYLRTADRLATTLADQQDWDTVVRIADAILNHDDCWEAAYRLQMRAYSALGNKSQVLRTYQRCVKQLNEALGVQPSPATVSLYKKLR